MLEVPLDWRGTQRRIGAEIAFTDRSESHSIRRATGQLAEISMNAVDYYGMSRPGPLLAASGPHRAAVEASAHSHGQRARSRRSARGRGCRAGRRSIAGCTRICTHIRRSGHHSQADERSAAPPALPLSRRRMTRSRRYCRTGQRTRPRCRSRSPPARHACASPPPAHRRRRRLAHRARRWPPS